VAVVAHDVGGGRIAFGAGQDEGDQQAEQAEQAEQEHELEQAT
jgi:hypothetical protein